MKLHSRRLKSMGETPETETPGPPPPDLPVETPEQPAEGGEGQDDATVEKKEDEDSPEGE
jgi:hypothetical protein